MLKIATWNVNSLRVRLPHLLDWLEKHQPDIVALQETKTPDEDFPVSPLSEAGYRVIFSGQKAYNGVALLSRLTACDICTSLPNLTDDPQRRFIAATYDTVRVLNLYVPNGAAIDSDKYFYKLSWLEQLKAYLNDQLKQYERVIVLGDFNIAPADADVYDPTRWQNCIVTSPVERAALQALYTLGLQDSFRLFEQPASCFSWWDYRTGAWRGNRGLRIDLILISTALVPLCTACTIDTEPRGLTRPSDHAPVVASFAL